jgi:N-acetylglucosaminyldiphosphoundecaprenol N-acetyl-beta-D-mannosaminyltransferase
LQRDVEEITMKELRILGIKITPAELWELHAEITRLINQGGPGFVLSGNIHGINLAGQLRWLADFYNRADVVRVDGAGVVLGALLLGHKIPPRITWADWGWVLAKYLAQKEHSVFLLGGPHGVAGEAARRLKQHAPRLIVLGTHHGFFLANSAEAEGVIDNINRIQPDVLVVGMGMPLQERWILENYRKIRAKVFITSGAAFEILAGVIRRCPPWMGELGLNWLFRLYQHPRRVARRYLFGNTIFFLNILKARLGHTKY